MDTYTFIVSLVGCLTVAGLLAYAIYLVIKADRSFEAGGKAGTWEFFVRIKERRK